MAIHLRLSLLGGVLMLLLSGCSKNKEGTLTLTFKGTFGNDPLVMLDYHDYIDNQRLQFTRSQFFASDIKLIDESGNPHNLSDVELIDLSFTNATAASDGVTLTFSGVPAGKNQKLELGIGVPQDINATAPSDYPSTSPLSNTAWYWLPWTSYIFCKTEGFLDTIPDGTDDATLGFAYHTGTDNLYRILNVGAIEVPQDGSVHVTYYLDLAKLLGMPDAPLDIKAKPQNHNPLDSVYVQAITNNLQKAFTVTIE